MLTHDLAQFDEWARNEGYDLGKDGDHYADEKTTLASQVWQASRESLRRSPDALALSGVCSHAQTLRKTSYIMTRDQMKVTGFVLTPATGMQAVVHMGAVRWLSNDQLRSVMHNLEVARDRDTILSTS